MNHFFVRTRKIAFGHVPELNFSESGRWEISPGGLPGLEMGQNPSNLGSIFCSKNFLFRGDPGIAETFMFLVLLAITRNSWMTVNGKILPPN